MSEPAVPVAVLRALIAHWLDDTNRGDGQTLVVLCSCAHELAALCDAAASTPGCPPESEVGTTMEAVRGQGEQALRSQGAHT